MNRSRGRQLRCPRQSGRPAHGVVPGRARRARPAARGSSPISTSSPAHGPRRCHPRGQPPGIESPGRDFEVEPPSSPRGPTSSMTTRPASMRTPAAGSRASRPSPPFDRGRILPSAVVPGLPRGHTPRDRHRHCPPHAVMNPPADIEVIFDKSRCHGLRPAAVPLPRTIGPVRSYDELRTRWVRRACPGFSSSWPMARRLRAWSPWRGAGRRRRHHRRDGAKVPRDAALQLPADPTLRGARGDRRIDRRPRREGVHVEEWIPKARLDGHGVRPPGRRDRRAGPARRGADEPDAHDQPAPEEPPRRRRGAPGPDGAGRLGPRPRPAGGPSTLPGLPLAGVDLLIAPGFRRHAVLEVNAFGDLLPGITCDGLDTYAAEVAAWLEATAGGLVIDVSDLIGTHDVLLITLDTLRYDVARDAIRRPDAQPGGRPAGRGWEERHSPASFTYAAHHAFFAGFLPTPARPASTRAPSPSASRAARRPPGGPASSTPPTSFRGWRAAGITPSASAASASSTS